MTASKQSAAPLVPTALTVHMQSRMLEIAFDDGVHFPCRSNSCACIRLRPKCAATARARKCCRPANAKSA